MRPLVTTNQRIKNLSGANRERCIYPANNLWRSDVGRQRRYESIEYFKIHREKQTMISVHCLTGIITDTQ